MAFEVFKLFGSIFVDTSEANNEMDKAGTNAEVLGKKFGDAAKKVAAFGDGAKRAGQVLTVTLTAPIVLVGKFALDMAFQLDATNAKFNTVFGEMADSIDTYIKDFQKLSPVTKAEARSMAAGFQDLLVPMGFARDTATTMTKEFMNLSGALYNANSDTRTQEEVSLALQSAMTGEYESLKALGIIIDADTVKRKAQSMGLADANGEISNQAEAQAVLQLITEQSTDAVAAFTEANLDAKTKVGIAFSAIKDVGAEVFQRFLPAIGRASDKVKELAEKFGNLPAKTQDMILAFAGIIAAIGPVLLVVGSLAGAVSKVLGLFSIGGGLSSVLGSTTAAAGMTATATTGLGAALSTLLAPVAIIGGAIAGLIAIFVGAWKNSEIFRDSVGNAFESIKNTISSAMGRISVAFTPVMEAFQGFSILISPVLHQIGNLIGTYLVPVIQDFIEKFVNGFTAIIVAIAPFITAIGNLLSFIGSFVGAVFALLNGDWASAWQFAQTMGQNFCDFIINALQGIWNLITLVFNNIVSVIQNAWTQIYNNTFGKLSELLTAIIAKFESIKAGIYEKVNYIYTSVSNTFENMVWAVLGKADNLKNWVIEKFNELVTFILGIPGQLAKVGEEIVNTVIRGIDAAWQNLKDKAQGIVDLFKGMFGGAGGGEGVGGGSPTVSGAIDDEYGWRVHPIYGDMRFHNGLDMVAGEGEPVFAARNGTIVYAGWNGGYGNHIRIDHGNGLETTYSHLSAIQVGTGAKVNQGDRIGLIGSTGDSTGPHLHFEAYRDGQSFNPRDLLGFEIGTNYVPATGPYLLHEGEAVVKKDENPHAQPGDFWKGYGGGVRIDPTLNFYGVKDLRPSESFRIFKRELDDLALGLV